MRSFRKHIGLAVPLDRANVDTDQIIPKQFLKRIERTGYGDFLFYDWRFSPTSEADSSFVLNQPKYRGASILIAGKNFGCGSSREHAPWALAQYGFRAILAPSFADIFANNSLKNGLLVVQLPESEIRELMRRAKTSALSLMVDLESCCVSAEDGFRAQFTINEFSRHCLLEGLDDIGLTLQQTDKIAAFEQSRPTWLPST
jgi:3-isopropylmalate/(R)-2-methylmalate dehydratase small subunit